jgi:ribosomal protein S12 methylthiotransferase
MKSSEETLNNVHIVTLGCSKNTVDSEVLAGQLRANNLVLASDARDADVLIINTCGFIDVAKEESIQTIIEAGELKKSGTLSKLIVMGCLSERYSSQLKVEMPEVDHFFGTEAYESILKAISPNLKYSLLGERVQSTPKHMAYVKISEGCDNPCSFCAIPVMRGNHRSIPMDVILKQAKHLVSTGVQELVLVAQDLTYYGKDVSGNRTLADVLLMLANESGAQWIRCMYAYPTQFPLDILPIIRDTPNICTYLDMPLQHASTNVLKSMRRGITRQTTERLIDTIRSTVPNIVLRSTFIVGYPNETEADFQELLEFVEQQKFERAGSFIYSQEDDTYAYILGNPIANEVKEERQHQLSELLRAQSFAYNQQRIGTTVRCLIEEQVSNNEYRGRTEADAPEVDNEVYVTSAQLLRAGTFVMAEIHDAHDFDLFGAAIL